MTLHIKDQTADRLARELARATGESLTEAVTKALQERLERAQRVEKANMEVRIARVKEILDQVDRLPVLDSRPADEIIGYDEHGLPRAADTEAST